MKIRVLRQIQAFDFLMTYADIATMFIFYNDSVRIQVYLIVLNFIDALITYFFLLK